MTPELPRAPRSRAEALAAAALLAVQVLFVVLTTRYLKDHFALIYGALEGIARFAVTAASLSTLRPGGISSIPTEAEVLAALEE